MHPVIQFVLKFSYVWTLKNFNKRKSVKGLNFRQLPRVLKAKSTSNFVSKFLTSFYPKLKQNKKLGWLITIGYYGFLLDLMSGGWALIVGAITAQISRLVTRRPGLGHPWCGALHPVVIEFSGNLWNALKSSEWFWTHGYLGRTAGLKNGNHSEWF